MSMYTSWGSSQLSPVYAKSLWGDVNLILFSVIQMENWSVRRMWPIRCNGIIAHSCLCQLRENNQFLSLSLMTVQCERLQTHRCTRKCACEVFFISETAFHLSGNFRSWSGPQNYIFLLGEITIKCLHRTSQLNAEEGAHNPYIFLTFPPMLIALLLAVLKVQDLLENTNVANQDVPQMRVSTWH